MSSSVLLVHSAGPQGPGEGSEPFVARLRKELGPGHEVLFPLMPLPADPHYEPWSERLDAVLSELERVVVVGHSLGGSVALKHLAETRGHVRISGLVLVATPFWGRDREWELEWALPKGWPGAETKLPPTFLFHSRDDEEAPFAHLELYAKRLPQAEAHPVDGNGHLFDRGDLTEIVATIRSLSAS